MHREVEHLFAVPACPSWIHHLRQIRHRGGTQATKEDQVGSRSKPYCPWKHGRNVHVFILEKWKARKPISPPPPSPFRQTKLFLHQIFTIPNSQIAVVPLFIGRKSCHQHGLDHMYSKGIQKQSERLRKIRKWTSSSSPRRPRW